MQVIVSSSRMGQPNMATARLCLRRISPVSVGWGNSGREPTIGAFYQQVQQLCFGMPKYLGDLRSTWSFIPRLDAHCCSDARYQLLYNVSACQYFNRFPFLAANLLFQAASHLKFALVFRFSCTGPQDTAASRPKQSYNCALFKPGMHTGICPKCSRSGSTRTNK